MPVLRVGTRNVLFVHIPKAGGTSLGHWLRTLGPVSLYAPRKRSPIPCVPQHFDAQLLQYLFDPSFFDYAFTVVRNPYDRIVSEYRYRLTNGKRRLFTPSFDRWVRRSFASYSRDRYFSSNHIRPQSDFLYPGVDVFRLEDGLDRVMQAIAARLDLAIGEEIPHANRSSDAPIDIHPATANMIYDFYQDDFEAFGYPRERQVLRIAA